MGKYTEALRKIEEERTQKVQGSNPGISLRGFHFRSYAIGILITASIVMLLVFAYGVYRGGQFEKPAVPEPPPISAVEQTASTDPGTQLLESVEKMMKVSYNPENPVVESATPQQSIEAPPLPSTPVPAPPKGFFTVQLAAYEQEETAKSQARELLEQGYQPLIFRGANLFKVCVGKFSTQEEANTELENLKASAGNVYQDAFIRFVKDKNET